MRRYPRPSGGRPVSPVSTNPRRKTLKPSPSPTIGGGPSHWGIREHAMAAGMNGLFLHGGVRPYGGSFLTFTDYCRPSIRLAALMGIGVIFVMTHDSIGLGEDG